MRSGASHSILAVSSSMVMLQFVSYKKKKDSFTNENRLLDTYSRHKLVPCLKLIVFVSYLVLI